MSDMAMNIKISVFYDVALAIWKIGTKGQRGEMTSVLRHFCHPDNIQSFQKKDKPTGL
jgi:hypothetical protein